LFRGEQWKLNLHCPPAKRWISDARLSGPSRHSLTVWQSA
jgi:hypothetical protein